MTPAPAVLPDLPGYDVLELLGRGGMGLVFKARHRVLGRLAAVKVPLLLADAEGRERFLREARAAAGLRHPNICPIFEVNDHGEYPCIVMAYIQGPTLDVWAAAAAGTARQVAEVVARLARAVEYAHSHGVIHRDIKPGNVLIDAESGQPVLMDFGLAKRTAEEDVEITLDGQVVGTPAYMAPEQAAGRLDQVGPRSDVYSLGALLYALVCGRPPFRGKGPEVLRQVQHDDPPPPRRLAPRLHRDLETVCLKAMAKRPQDRYASALALAEDLERFAAGDPILARRQGLAARAWRQVRRHKAAAAGLAGVLGLVAAGYLSVGAFQANRRAQALRDLEGQLQADLASPSWSEEFFQRLQARLDRMHELVPEQADAARRNAIQRLGDSVLGSIHQPRLPADEVARVTRRLDLLAGFAPEAAAPLRQALQARRREWEQVARLEPPFANLDSVFPKAVAEAGATAALARPLTAVPHQPAVLSRVSCQGDVKLEAVFGPSWGTATEVGVLLNQADRHPTEALCLAFAPDGKTLATSGTEGAVKLWDVGTGQVRATLEAHEGWAFWVAFAPRGGLLATSGADRVVRLWDPVTGRRLTTLAGHTGKVRCVAFSPDGNTLASCGHDGTVRLWDAAAGSSLAVLNGHTATVWALAFSPDGRSLASCSDDRTVKLWDVAGRRCRTTCTGHQAPITSVVFSPDGRTVASCSAEGALRFWDAETGESRLALPGPRQWQQLAFTPDGRSLAVGGSDETIWLRDPATGNVVGSFPGHRHGLAKNFAFSPDGRMLASAAEDLTIKLWDVETREERLTLQGDRGYRFVVGLPLPAPGGKAPTSLLAAQAQGGLVRLQIWRNGVLQMERPVRIGDGRLQLRAHREGDELTFAVNDLPPLQFEDVFPVQGGLCGLYWAPGVGLERLEAFTRAPAAQQSYLERGDELFARGRLQDALDSYRDQARAAGDSAAGQEARCKEAFCLLALNRTDEALRRFEQVAGEEGPRWPVTAAFQLWVLLVRDQRLDEADAVLDRLTTRSRFEELARLIPDDVRRRILKHYANARVPDMVRADRRALRHLERGEAVVRLVGGSAAEGWSIKYRKMMTLHALGDLPQARAAAEAVLAETSVSDADQLRARVLNHYVWILVRGGDKEQVVAEIDRRLFVRPGVLNDDFLPLLLERARVQGALGRGEQAEKDLDELFRHEGNLPPVCLAGAWLLRGFLRERRGDTDGAVAAWREGARTARAMDPPDSALLSVLASLAGDLTEEDVRRVLDKTLGPLLGSSPVAAGLQQRVLSREFLTSVARQVWRQPRGHEFARRLAFLEMSFQEALRGDIAVHIVEALRQGTLADTPSADQDELMWHLANDVVEAYARGDFTESHAILAFITWNGVFGEIGWAPLAQSLPPTLRGPTAYVYGLRSLRLNKRTEAIPLFRTALAGAPAGSSLGRLAQAELDRLGSR
jgi:WD40 repeat protein/tetratricopeptide (TPR) repeat protein/predicted Ser/Thr protein kinase